MFQNLELIGRVGRRRLALALAGALSLTAAGCQDEGGLSGGRAYAPIPERTLARMDEMGTTKYSPVLLRAFKKESELEVWKMKADGAYALLKTYPMCRWSGQLGPKKREGDRQVPEGFYYITPKRMNPNSAYYLSFNVGYPNAYDRAHGRTGSHIMVHGACSSRGCFSMTDEQISEIYAVVREAFTGGQKAVQLQSLPFRMTPKNLAKHRLDKNIKFWKAIKEGSDSFEVAKREPSVLVCNRKYVFNGKPQDASARVNARGYCPPMTRDENLVAAIRKKQQQDETKVAALISKGTNPVKIIYADGGQHRAFAHVSTVSRPDALARGPIEIALDDRGQPLKAKAKDQPGKGKPAKTRLADGANSKSGKTVTAAASKAGADAKPAQIAANSSAKAKDAAAAAPVTASAYAPAETKKPILSRWFGGLSGLVGGSSAKPAPAADPAASPASGSAPLPPSRKAVSAPGTKPKRDKSASVLPQAITGAYTPLPAGLSAYAPLR